MLICENISKVYTSGERELTVLDAVSFELPVGQRCAIVGPSGSGKTTLLGLCAGLDRPTSGALVVDGRDLATMDEDALSRWRATEVGFVFQNFRLLPTLTALENVMVPLELQGAARGARQVATDLLDRVGLGARMDHYPAQLSGGEQQRVALARAFVNSPKWLFADEPTGNLDTETGAPLADLLFDLDRERDATLLLITHDRELAARADRVLTMRGGKLTDDSTTNPPAAREVATL